MIRMVTIEIKDEIWELFKKSWALFGIRTHTGLVRMLEGSMEDSSKTVIEDAGKHLLSDEPEALFLREVGLMKEKLLKHLVELGFSREVADKLVENLRKQSISDQGEGKFLR